MLKYRPVFTHLTGIAGTKSGGLHNIMQASRSIVLAPNKVKLFGNQTHNIKKERNKQGKTCLLDSLKTECLSLRS